MNEPILIVDDTPINQRLLLALLGGLGYDLAVARDGASALAAIAARPPRLILMDINLPDVDGIALTQQLKADPATRAIAIVIASASVEAADRARARAAGADDIVPTPIDRVGLRALVRELLDRQ